ncbi:MAG: putative toxin-antitoxin system toxin component, PIN family [Phycisphaerae bacterium]
MPLFSLRVVLDTNIVLRGLLTRDAAAGRLLRAVEERRLLVLLSKPVLAEYRAVLTDRAIVARFPSLTARLVELALLRLRYFGDYVPMTHKRFHYPRDPRDEKFLELAIAGNATHLISGDQDLLALASSHGAAAKQLRQRLPGLHILEPGEFLERYDIRTPYR